MTTNGRDLVIKSFQTKYTEEGQFDSLTYRVSDKIHKGFTKKR